MSAKSGPWEVNTMHNDTMEQKGCKAKVPNKNMQE